MFRSKYHTKYKKEAYRESKIQELMSKNNFDRNRASHYYDFNQEIKKHNLGSKISFKTKFRNPYGINFWYRSYTIYFKNE